MSTRKKLRAPLAASLVEHLEAIIGAPLETAHTVHGGDINRAARLICSGGSRYFLKWNTSAPRGLFPAEAQGLQWLAQTGALRVPHVVALGDAEDERPAFLLMDYIEPEYNRSPDANVMARLGEGLAAVHDQSAATYGLENDNFIGRLPQPNTPCTSWVTFYRDQRLGAQMAIARQRGRLPRHREDLLTRLLERLGDWLDDSAITPALLHGDLWGGNYLVTRSEGGAQPVLIDPAIYFGHREVDLAMTELFGGFSREFYAAYFAAHPLPGYEDRRALYQLYPMLVHLNHFGESYGGPVDDLAARYVGPVSRSG